MTMEALPQRVDERLDYGHSLEFGSWLRERAAERRAFSPVPAIAQECGA